MGWVAEIVDGIQAHQVGRTEVGIEVHQLTVVGGAAAVAVNQEPLLVVRGEEGLEVSNNRHASLAPALDENNRLVNMLFSAGKQTSTNGANMMQVTSCKQ